MFGFWNPDYFATAQKTISAKIWTFGYIKPLECPHFCFFNWFRLRVNYYCSPACVLSLKKRKHLFFNQFGPHLDYHYWLAREPKLEMRLTQKSFEIKNWKKFKSNPGPGFESRTSHINDECTRSPIRKQLMQISSFYSFCWQIQIKSFVIWALLKNCMLNGLQIGKFKLSKLR